MIDRKEDNQFHLVSKYEPSGDQPQAIEALVDNIEGGEKAQILKGALYSRIRKSFSHSS